MPKVTIRTIAAALFAILFGSSELAGAAAPQTLTQQGRLLDMNGAPELGTFTMTFTIYDAATAGNLLWTETQTIALSDGYFSAVLGSRTPIAASVFDGNIRYLGVTVNSDPEMTPRESINSVPYALVASNATGDLTPNSVSVGGTMVINSAGQWVGPSSGLIGPAGAQGAIGPQGARGPTGSTGAPGSSVVASTELAGPGCMNGGVRISSPSGTEFACNGSTGPAGPTGPTGTIGPQGPIGLQGPAGPQGDVGPQGASGPVGAMGASVTGMSEPIGPNCKYGGAALMTGAVTTYVCNGVPGAPGPQGPAGPAGSPGLVYFGAWSSATAYTVGDVVTFAGTAYVSSVPTTGVQPPASGWDVLASQGPAGPTGPQGAFPGTTFVKTGNNGSVSCDQFCAGSNWGGTTGTCIGSKEIGNGTFIACNTAPGSGTSLTCTCYSF